MHTYTQTHTQITPYTIPFNPKLYQTLMTPPFYPPHLPPSISPFPFPSPFPLAYRTVLIELTRRNYVSGCEWYIPKHGVTHKGTLHLAHSYFVRLRLVFASLQTLQLRFPLISAGTYVLSISVK